MLLELQKIFVLKMNEFIESWKFSYWVILKPILLSTGELNILSYNKIGFISGSSSASDSWEHDGPYIKLGENIYFLLLFWFKFGYKQFYTGLQLRLIPELKKLFFYCFVSFNNIYFFNTSPSDPLLFLVDILFEKTFKHISLG